MSYASLTKKQKELIDFIMDQISIDLSGCVAESQKRGYVFIELYDEEIDRKFRLVESLGFSSKKFAVTPNGHKKVALVLN